jgi:DDE superfamily endonuclease
VVTARAEWLILSVGIDPRRLVFLDETFGTTAMTRLYGWGPTSARVNYAAPHGHWKTTTFVAAFRLGGLFAPMVVRSGDILVMDNLQTHKVKGVAEAVEQRGARVLYLPPYSPDFNPIEQVFSKVKNELRRRELRTIAALENAFGESLDWISPQDALHYFRNSGYPTGRN